MKCSLTSNEELLALHAANLAVCEVSLGSVLHTLRLPLAGQLLSLNQIAFLTHASCTIPTNTAPIVISTTVAALKSLAPLGKKLTPMLAICIQGCLYNCGIFIFGNTSLGRIVGAMMASLWSFIQPLLILTLFFGTSLWDSIEKLSTPLKDTLSGNAIITLILFSVLLKVGASMAITLFVQKRASSYFNIYKKLLSKATIRPLQLSSPITIPKALFLSLRDLVQPLFLVSLGIVASVSWYVQESPEWLLTTLLRPTALAVLFFFCARTIPFHKIIRRGKIVHRAQELFQLEIANYRGSAPSPGKGRVAPFTNP